MTRLRWTKLASIGAWFIITLLTLFLVRDFVSMGPEAPLTKTKDLLIRVDSIKKTSEEIIKVREDFVRLAISQLEDLEKNVDSKNSSEIKQQIDAITSFIEKATEKDTSRWSKLETTITKELDPLRNEAEVLGNILSGFQVEVTQSKAILISNLLWFLLISMLLITLLFISPNLTGMMQFAVRFVRGAKVPGFELSFARDDDAQKNRDINLWFSDAFSELRIQAKRELKLFVEQQEIEQVFKSTVRKIIDHIKTQGQNQSSLVDGAKPPIINDDAIDKIRCTIHVRDVIFKNYFCQLVDYYPNRPFGGRFGRFWPISYGMIGRVWRSGRSELRSIRKNNSKDMNATLVDEYSMTDEQVKQLLVTGHSFLCLLLRDDDAGNPLAILYMDAPHQDVFGYSNEESNDSQAVRENGKNFENLYSICDDLVKRLSDYSRQIYGKAPLIEVMESNES